MDRAFQYQLHKKAQICDIKHQQILRYSHICSYTKNLPYPKCKQTVLKQNLTTEVGIIKMQKRLKVSSRFTCFDGSESEKAETRVEKRVHSSEIKKC